MITFSKLGQKGRGRLGNQLFQIASTASIAKRNNHSFFFPKWEYEKYFDYDFPKGKSDTDFIELKEKKFPYYEWEIGNGNYDLDGWLQCELYFEAELVKKMFSFEPSFQQNVLQQHESFFNRKTVLISVRRGDFVHNDLFFQLSFKYYLLALFNNFPDWEERNLIFASDDFGYCQYHFGHLKNAFFLEGRKPIEQLVIGTHCDDFIISNSTFSWWIAWLGEDKRSKVICPIKNYRGRKSQPDDKDYYPKRWIKFDHRNKWLSMNYFPLTLKANLMHSKSFYNYKKRKLKIRLRNLLS